MVVYHEGVGVVQAVVAVWMTVRLSPLRPVVRVPVMVVMKVEMVMVEARMLVLDHLRRFLKGDLNGIVRARRLSQATMSNIRQNLFFAFVYNALGVPVAAGVLFPVFGILLSPIIAAAAMALSSVSVIANAARLRAVKL